MLMLSATICALIVFALGYIVGRWNRIEHRQDILNDRRVAEIVGMDRSELVRFRRGGVL